MINLRYLLKDLIYEAILADSKLDLEAVKNEYSSEVISEKRSDAIDELINTFLEDK